jgi:hypothetical protein
MTGRKIRCTAAVVALLVCISAGAADRDEQRRLMTQGKLDADLGNHDEASASFRTIADDESAPRSLRWEALVRFGLARSAAGDPGASAEAFRTVLANNAEDPEAMRFLTNAVASSVPGKVWPDFRTKLEELLRSAPVVAMEELGMGLAFQPKKVTLSQEDAELSAVWKHFARAKRGDSYIHEAAAYELDKMLGLDMVPPTVKRAIEGREGTLQLWIHGCKIQKDLRGDTPDPTEWGHQLSRMKVFDHVIANRDRNQGNILVDPSWAIVLIDHTRAFLDPETLPELPDRFDRRLVERLRQLSRPELQTRLKGLLTEAQVDGVLARRDALLARVEKLVAEKGEQAVLF